MKTIKEKPQGVNAQKSKSPKNKGQPTGRSQPAISAKQAAKLLKDKYVRKLDQRQPETGSAETQAVDQVEGAGRWVVDELLTHEQPRSPRQPDQRIKELPQDMPEAAGPSDTPPAAPETASLPHESTASPRQWPGPTPKEKAAQVRGTHPRTAVAPAEPPAPPAFAAPTAAPRLLPRLLFDQLPIRQPIQPPAL